MCNSEINIHHKNKFQQTALSLCLYYKNFYAIKYLIQCGLDINHVDQDKRTCLYWACRDNDLKAVRNLIKLKCDVN